MVKAKKAAEPKEKEKAKAKNENVKFLRGLYQDFRDTMGDAFGDAGSVWKKNKLVIIIAFVAFLLYKNKQFSIEQFVKRLEDKVKGDIDW